VHDEVQREIEGGDGADHANGNTECETELSFSADRSIEWYDLTSGRPCLGGRELERADCAIYFHACSSDRLGALLADQLGKVFLLQGENCCCTIEDFGTLPRRKAASKCQSGRFDRANNILGITLFDNPDERTVIGT
jgi:hypothetical protein